MKQSHGMYNFSHIFSVTKSLTMPHFLMPSRFIHVFSLALIAALMISGCKSASTDSNNNNNSKPVNIGDTVPAKGSGYKYSKSQLDVSGNIIPTTTNPNISASINNTGQSILGKNNVYTVNDDLDSAYYSYESNSDVSMYLVNPGYYLINNPPPGVNPIDETLQAIENAVFHNWITLPIASKSTITPADQTPSFTINGQQVLSNIHTVIEYIDSSGIFVKDSKDTLAARHCRITITAQVAFANDHEVLTHTRNIWFAPKIGYIAQEIVRTDMPALPIYVVPRDTTAILKVLTSYTFH